MIQKDADALKALLTEKPGRQRKSTDNTII